MNTNTTPRTFTKDDTRRIYCPGFTLWTVTVAHEAGTITPTVHTVAADNADGARAVARYRVAESRGISGQHLVATSVEAIGPNPEAAAWQAAANS